MDNLKRFYFSLVAGYAMLTGHKSQLIKEEDVLTVSRVSRQVNNYRTHFFNL